MKTTAEQRNNYYRNYHLDVVRDVLDDFAELEAENANLKEGLEKAADTFLGAANAFYIFGKATASEAMKIAECETRALLDGGSK